jgi:hypothetical protein
MTFPHRNPALQTNVLPDGHAVVFDGVSSWAHTLNPVGALVWEYSDGNHSLSEIVAEVHGLGQSWINDSQVNDFVGEMKRSGLIHEDQIRGDCDY